MARTHNDLTLFQDALRKYKAEVEKLHADYVQELANIPHIYHPDYVNSQKVTAQEHFKEDLKELQEKYCNQIESVKGDLIKQESNKDGSFISFDLLARLNTIDQANVNLTKGEYLSLIAECIEVGSSICNRKLADIIKKRNMESIIFPSKESATELIDTVASNTIDIMKRYDGVTGFKSDSASYLYKREVDGDWIEKMNVQFNQVTTADLKNLSSEKIKEKLINKFDTSKISDDGESVGKRAAEEYSRKMMQDPKAERKSSSIAETHVPESNYNNKGKVDEWRESMRVSAFIPAPDFDD